MNIWRHWGQESSRRTWCAPGAEMSNLEWRLRYGEPSRNDILAAASVISCYRVLVELPERDRREVIREIRKGPSSGKNDG